jgi:hypothetical protein
VALLSVATAVKVVRNRIDLHTCNNRKGAGDLSPAMVCGSSRQDLRAASGTLVEMVSGNSRPARRTEVARIEETACDSNRLDTPKTALQLRTRSKVRSHKSFEAAVR